MPHPSRTWSMRGATERDLPAVARLLEAADLPRAGLTDQFGGAYVVAESAAGIVGAAGLEVHGCDGLLRSVVVDPEWRGDGLGLRLVQDRLAAARAARLRSVCLLTTSARDYFLALGFRVHQRSEAPAAILESVEFAGACPAAAAFLRLDLGASEAGRALPAVAVALLLLGGGSAGAEDWTQWRGAARDGTSRAMATREWPEALRPAWRVEVGEGQSSPVVSGGTVFVFGREGEDEVARALDLQTGRPLWRRGYPAPYRVYPGAAAYGRGPRSTPVVDSGRLFTLGISGILSAFEAASGRLLWQKDFAGRFRESAPPFGTSMSPLLADGLLVMHAGGHEGGALIAFDPATGAEKWVLEGAGPSYSSPIVGRFGGSAQVVAQVHREVVGVDLASGRRLWSLPFVTPCDQNIVTPLVAGDLLVLSSLGQGTMAYRIKGAATPERVWHTSDVAMYMSSPVQVQDRLVGLSHRKRGQFFALDAGTGAVRWLSAGAQADNAALVVLGDSLLVLMEDGRLLILPKDATGFEPARSYQVAQAGTYAHPVPTRLGLLIRDERGLSLQRLS